MREPSHHRLHAGHLPCTPKPQRSDRSVSLGLSSLHFCHKLQHTPSHCLCHPFTSRWEAVSREPGCINHWRCRVLPHCRRDAVRVGLVVRTQQKQPRRHSGGRHLEQGPHRWCTCGGRWTSCRGCRDISIPRQAGGVPALHPSAGHGVVQCGPTHVVIAGRVLWWTDRVAWMKPHAQGTIQRRDLGPPQYRDRNQSDHGYIVGVGHLNTIATCVSVQNMKTCVTSQVASHINRAVHRTQPTHLHGQRCEQLMPSSDRGCP